MTKKAMIELINNWYIIRGKSVGISKKLGKDEYQQIIWGEDINERDVSILLERTREEREELRYMIDEYNDIKRQIYKSSLNEDLYPFELDYKLIPQCNLWSIPNMKKKIKQFKVTQETIQSMKEQLAMNKIKNEEHKRAIDELKEKLKECDEETIANINYDVITRKMERLGKCRDDEEARKRLTCPMYDVLKYGIDWNDRDILEHHYDIMIGGGYIMK